MRRLGLVSLVAGMGLAIVGCGGGDSTGGPPSSLIGRWELRQKSDDGGETFDNVDNQFQFTFNSDGTWDDSDGDGGTWSTNGGRLTIGHTDGSATEFFLWRLEGGGDVLRITITDFQGAATDDISLYVRIF